MEMCVCPQSLSHAQLCETSQIVACQAPLSTQFPRQEYQSELPCPTPRDLPDPGIQNLLHKQVDSSPLVPPGKPMETARKLGSKEVKNPLIICYIFVRHGVAFYMPLFLPNVQNVLSCSVVSDSLGPHGLQRSRLLCPWNFTGENNRVGCYSLLQRSLMIQGQIQSLHLVHQQVDYLPLVLPESHSVVSVSLRPHGMYSPWDSPGQNTRVGSCSLLQEIFPAQGLNPGLPLCRKILYQLSHQGNGEVQITALLRHN